MPKLVIIMGPQAVGKMTVGQELAKLTGLKLFHNHMTIDLVSNFFDYGTDTGKHLVGLFRREIFNAVAKSDLYGLIFTYVCAFDVPADWQYLKELQKQFESEGSEVYFVELSADYNLRLERNQTPNRLEHKPTKRDVKQSESMFISLEATYRLNSYEGEITEPNYLKIDNTNLSPEAVASQIKSHFNL